MSGLWKQKGYVWTDFHGCEILCLKTAKQNQNKTQTTTATKNPQLIQEDFDDFAIF